MKTKHMIMAATAAIALSSTALIAQTPQTQQPQAPMTFFVTSTDQSGNLGGLAGADAICQKLAADAGAGNKTWRAYLSTQGADAVNARDRIGKGPWHNAKGVQVAANVADLHGDVERDRNNLWADTSIDEKGNPIPGRGAKPQNKHDILTGSTSTGMAYPAGEDMTCKNWTSDGEGKARLGHHDRQGGGNTSWNSVHNSRSCSLADLNATGGAGKFYCFAAD
jgi:hypothetical protein